MNKSYNFRWLDFKITNRCNNNCVYCGANNDLPLLKLYIDRDYPDNPNLIREPLTISRFEMLEKMKKTFPEVYNISTATQIKKFLDGGKGKAQVIGGFKEKIKSYV